MKTEPMVSVIVPTYNYARFLPRALDSVLAQTYADLEIIVVDDGSTDGTSDVASPYAGKIRYLRKDNGGVSSARNLGIENSRGRLIAFLDADDAWRPEKLARQVAFMEANPGCGMSFTDMSHWVGGVETHRSYLRERSFRHVSSGRIYHRLLEECFVFVPTVMARPECFRVAGLFDTALDNAEDWDMWLRIARNFEVGFLDEPLTMRHAHEAGATTHAGRYHGGRILVLERILAAPPDEAAAAIARRKLSEAHWHLGYHLFRSGDMRGCRSHMVQSMRHGGDAAPAVKYCLLSCLPRRVSNLLRSVLRRGPFQG